jgi:RHS repeat-associated protein
LGNRTQTVLPGGRALNYLFYGSGHLHQVNLDGKVVSDFERDALYREVRRSQGQLRSEFAYDPAGRLSAQQVLREAAAGAAPCSSAGLTSPAFPATTNKQGLSDIQNNLKGVIERHYQYDRSGQLVQWLDRHRGLTRYRYDAAGRITRSQIGLMKDWGALGVRADAPGNVSGHPMAANEQFHWDAGSNPLADEASVAAGRYVPGNRLLVWQDARYAYDEHGNLVERLQGKRDSAVQTRTRFTWDAAHQLVGADVARGPDEIATVQSFSYSYDALGRRVAKTDEFGITHFAWDGDRMAVEQRGGNETTHLYHPESFVPLAQVHDGELHHLHTDHLGTPLEASNDAGEITWRVTYRTWGNVVVEEIGGIEQRVRFQGQYFDVETELHNNRFRYYDPKPGRFVGPDPIGLRGGYNLFQYGANPIGFVDPLGLVGNPATATHITYIGIKDGKAYVGYASKQGCQDPEEVLKYRYNGKFSKFDGDMQPIIIFAGYGQSGKDIARGLEQSTYEKLDKSANKQRPVGPNNKRKDEYAKAAAKHSKCANADPPVKPKCK